MAQPQRGPAVLPDNPFQDPAALQPRPGPAALDAYSPFGGGAPPPPYQAPSAAPPAAAAAAQPPRRASPTEPRNYGSYGTQASTAAAAAELLKRQEELNRKAEELDRRERELQNAALGSAATRLNNWPPLPSFCPVKPCFYQDIPVEIPADFQKTVSTMYYLWMECDVRAAGDWHTKLGIQWLDIEPDSAAEEHGCGCDDDPGVLVLHSSGRVGHHYAEKDPLSVPPDRRQLPESTGGVCRGGLLQPGSAHCSSQCCRGCRHQCLPGTVAGRGPWLLVARGLFLRKTKSKLHFHWIPVCLHQLSEVASSQLGKVLVPELSAALTPFLTDGGWFWFALVPSPQRTEEGAGWEVLRLSLAPVIASLPAPTMPLRRHDRD
ncbi:secretory carrier-associated membrane protein 3 isoform 1-T1 [Chlamydotis macqueenii]